MRVALGRLKTRPEFLRIAGSGRKTVTAGAVVQSAPSSRAGVARIGLTATRKLGGAVVRNRARRRLREAARAAADAAQPGHDYVLIARAGTLTRPWAKLVEDLRRAFAGSGS